MLYCHCISCTGSASANVDAKTYWVIKKTFDPDKKFNWHNFSWENYTFSGIMLFGHSVSVAASMVDR